MGGPAGWVVIDLGPSQVRAYGERGVTRQQAAVLCDGGELVFGREAARRAGADPGAFESRLPEAVDEVRLALGMRVYPMAAVIRAFLRHVIAGVTSAVPHGLVLVLPTAWGAVRRGAVERAAEGLAEQVVTLGSAESAIAAARAEKVVTGDGPVVVIEQWPNAAISAICARSDRGAGFPRGRAMLEYTAYGASAVEREVVAGRVGGADDAILARLVDGVRAPRTAGAVIVVPRAGWEFDRALQAARGGGAPVGGQASVVDGVRFTDGDCVLRGACRAFGAAVGVGE